MTTIALPLILTSYTAGIILYANHKMNSKSKSSEK